MEQPAAEYTAYRNSAEEINRAAREDPENFIRRSEESYHDDIRAIARRIAGEEPLCRLVMLAGPSSSGKTTAARLLEKALRSLGVGSESISLDDFYLGEGLAPLLPDGKHDYECLEALDAEEIRRCLCGLAEQGRCEMPVFDFERHVRYPHRRRVVLQDREVAVVEGIHALNPELVDSLPDVRRKRVYISVKQGVVDRRGVLLSPDEIRLVRRIVRDFNFRQTGPDTTLSMWPNVMRGERRYIKPFRKDADVTVNSFHAYELCVLRDQAIGLLRTVPADSPNRAEARRLAEGLAGIEPIDRALVPGTSMIREFIGGGAE